MPPITRSQTKLQKQMQSQNNNVIDKTYNVIDKTYNINEFIIGILSRAANVTNSNIDSDFDSFMKKYTDNDRLRLHQNYPELDIVKVKYEILVSCYYNDDEEYEDGFIYIALPKNIQGNIENINLNNIYVKFHTELNSFTWTIISIKHCSFIK
jgi:hypothetical protein